MNRTTSLLLAAVLTVTQTACTAGQGTKAAPDQAAEQIASQSAGLTINFDDGEGIGFTGEDKEIITEIIAESERAVRALLPTLPVEIEVSAVLIDRNIDVVGGVTGRADAPRVVLIEISRVYPGGVSAAAQASLASTIFHEFHHLNRGWTRYWPYRRIPTTASG
ncbi:MAG: hypothetical protein ACI9BV_004004 [Rhodothermales bacterium]|jgi:hypothetical protein